MILRDHRAASATDSSPRSARQEELIGELERLVRRDGFSGLGVGEIASRLNCSRSTLYAIAPSKQQLFLVLVDRIVQRVRAAALVGVRRAKEPRGRLEGYLAGALGQIRGIGNPFLIEMQRDPHASRLLSEFQRMTVADLRGLIEEGIQAGDFQPVNTLLAAELLDAAVTRIQDPRVLAETGLTASEALGDLIQVVTRGLRK